jgi:hypothetical protein
VPALGVLGLGSLTAIAIGLASRMRNFDRLRSDASQ